MEVVVCCCFLSFFLGGGSTQFVREAHSSRIISPSRARKRATAHGVQDERLERQKHEYRKPNKAATCGPLAGFTNSWMADAIRLDSIFRFDQGRSDSTDPIRPACKAPGAQLMEVSRNSVLPDAFSRLRIMHLDSQGSS